MKNNEYKRTVYGFGLRADDDHVRITKGDNFYLRGGSAASHSAMRAKIIEFNAFLRKKGVLLDDANDEQLLEAAQAAGFKFFKKVRSDQLFT